MRKFIFLAAVISGLILIQALPALAGCCFWWMDDGSRSGCDEGVANATDCANACAAGGWDRYYYLATDDCTCEGTSNDLPVSREIDVTDIDGDGDLTETIRWRYVVVIDDCRIVGDECQERHRLLRCWKDDDHDWTNIEPVVTGYEEPGQEYWWVTICTDGTCECQDVDQSTYPGCDATNYHYWERCVTKGESIPTLSEWGLILFSLLILSLVTVVVTRRRLAVAGGVDVSTGINERLFFPKLYGKALTITLALAIIILAAAFALSEAVPTRDIVGTILSAGIVAYIIHLWMASTNSEK